MDQKGVKTNKLWGLQVSRYYVYTKIINLSPLFTIWTASTIIPKYRGRFANTRGLGVVILYM